MINSKGYTLAELAIVVLIIGMLMMISLPRYEGLLGQTRLSGSARRFVSAVKYTWGQAGLSGSDLYLQCDLDKGHYWVAVPVKVSGQEYTLEESNTVLGKRARLSQGIDFKDIVVEPSGKVAKGMAVVQVFEGSLSGFS